MNNSALAESAMFTMEDVLLHPPALTTRTEYAPRSLIVTGSVDPLAPGTGTPFLNQPYDTDPLAVAVSVVVRPGKSLV
jgi:hypothetical protein